MRRTCVHYLLAVSLVLISTIGVDLIGHETPIALADGFIDFENGVDSQPIQSSIPGLQFTTTEGYDWVYADWRTGEYNGPYPDGGYYSNGNFFAWLGPNQGAGRIDFTESGATYLQVWASSAYGLIADAYDASGTLIDTEFVTDNLDTGQMARLRVEAPSGQMISYVIFHDTGNYWLIDDLSTDASGVPTTRPPVVLIPGLMGSQLNVYNTQDEEETVVWPPLYDPSQHSIDLEHAAQLDLGPLYLAENGSDPADARDFVFSNAVLDYFYIRLFGRQLSKQHYYDALVQRLTEAGFNVYQYHYDWRLDVRTPLHGRGHDQERENLDDFIDWVLWDSGAQQVNIVAHSLGGLVTRAYVSASPENAAQVEQAIILGTPYLGAPKTMMIFRAGHPLVDGWHLQIPLLSSALRNFAQNAPAMYQILPSQRYLDVAGGDWFWFNDQQYNWSQTQGFLREYHNSGLVNVAEELHGVVDYWDAVPGEVAFRFIVGTGVENTPGGIREQTQPWWRGGDTWDIIPTNGDGTVPLVSASLEGNGYYYRGDVPIWYARRVDHGGLTQQDYILDFIVAMLATPPNVQALQRAHHTVHSASHSASPLYLGNDRPTPPRYRVTAPPTPPEMSQTPFPLDGAQVSVFQAAALHVYDSSGRHTGPTDDEVIETEIPGSTYTTIGNAIFATVPASATYEIRIEPDGDQEFDLRVRDVEGLATQFIQHTLVYISAQVGMSGTASLTYDPDLPGNSPMLGLDFDSDGSVDAYSEPTGELGLEDSYDFDAPLTTIHLEGVTDTDGWYTGIVTITLTAIDDQSGVAAIEYTIDEGHTIQKYGEPFQVLSEQTPVVLAQAIDRAGNREAPAAAARLRPTYIYLPLVLRVYGPSIPSTPTWSPTTGLSAHIVYALIPDPSNCHIRYAGTDNGVYKSTDTGGTWVATNLSGILIASVVVDPLTPQTVYAATWGQGVYKSTDGGTLWSQINNGLGKEHWLYALAITPDGGALYAATINSGVYKTTNGGASWSPVNNGLGNLEIRALTVDSNNGQVVYAGATDGAYKSTNGGASWSVAGSGLAGRTVWILAVDPSDSATVFAGTDSGVYRSTIGGATWTPVGLTGQAVYAVIVDPLDGQRRYAGTDGNGVYRSTGSGATWAAMNAGLGNLLIESLALDGGSCHTLQAGTHDGVWTYSD